MAGAGRGGGFQVIAAEFLGGAASLGALPGAACPEVVLIGRSNCGKSSLINRMTNRRHLARVSGEPGRTREINLFKTRVRGPDGEKRTVTLIDMPGFGFARRGRPHHALQRAVRALLSERSSVRAVCLLNGARRRPEEEELATRDLTAAAGRHVLVVVTKIDQLNRREREKSIEIIAQGYGLEPDDLVLSGRGLSCDPLWERIWDLSFAAGDY